MARFLQRASLLSLVCAKECTVGRVCRLLNFRRIIRIFTSATVMLGLLNYHCGLKCGKTQYGPKSFDFVEGHPGVFINNGRNGMEEKLKKWKRIHTEKKMCEFA